MELRRLSDKERALAGAARLRQEEILAPKRAIADSEGRVSAPLVVLLLLAGLERRGLITWRERGAGERFHDDFRVAGLDGLKAASLIRVANGAVAGQVPGNERARRAVLRAIGALGGSRALVGSVAWHVLGLEWPLKDWAALALRADREAARGVLLAALDALARHFQR